MEDSLEMALFQTVSAPSFQNILFQKAGRTLQYYLGSD